MEDVIGCKWSVSVLTNVGKGIHRPGELERSIEGISTKVLSERFRKLVEYGLLEKKFQRITTAYGILFNGERQQGGGDNFAD